MEEKKETQIDFVIAWVDGGDPAWQRERDRYGKMGEKTAVEETGEREKSGVACDTRDVRYRDWDCLRFWFRSVEQNAPWVHKIYFVTWGHVPKWLNGNHPKLEIVRHEDYIPGEFLPTFNSHTIELNFHRIPGLSEQFVYFNDDMFLLRQVSPGQFFRDGKPLDMLALQPVVANREDAVMPYIYLNNAMVLARYFDKRENMKQQPGAYWHPGYPLLYFGYNLLERMFPRFTGFYTVHGPSPLLKNTYEALCHGLRHIRKYERLLMVQHEKKEPQERYDGLVRFCAEHGFGHEYLASIRDREIREGDLFILVSDRDLVTLLKQAERQQMTPGREFGIISYNDTPLKEILAGGITTLSTDFRQMGLTLAQLIFQKGIRNIENPWMLNIRRSL